MLSPEDTQYLLAMPEVQTLLEAKLAASRSELAAKKAALATIVKRATMLQDEWQRYMMLEYTFLLTESKLGALQREIGRISRCLHPRKLGIDEEAIQTARKYPLAELFPTALRGGGHRKLGLCPFHAEGSPSCVVYVKTNTFHCFGCQAHGNAIDFVMRLNGLKFVDAVKSLQVK